MTDLVTSPAPPAPDGIGVPLETIRLLLKDKHNTVVSPNDPVLYVGTMLNAYLGVVEEQNARLGDGMTRLLAEQTSKYVADVKKATDALSTSISDASLEGFRKISNEHIEFLKTFRSNLIWLALITGGCTFINILALIKMARG
ncbi:MAG: hypothetical protein LBH42_03460 [Treponema sp.]|jgi:hypothetical protein|nr:hypothetical protein [Treponema sp.]